MNNFAVSGLDQAAFNVIGGWQAQPASAVEGAVSFSGSAADDEMITWSVTLPAGEREAREMLADQESELAESQALVKLAGEQMSQLTPAMAVAPTVSFGTTIEISPERELMETLGALRGQQADAVSFGLKLPGLPGDWRQSVDEYLDFSRQMINLMKPTLRVETHSGSQLLAVSYFKLDGDAAHSWPTNYVAGQSWQHGKTVRLTLQTRMALFQLFAQVSAGAIGLAPRFAGGAGTALLALPATYKYIKSTVAQFKRLRTLESQLSVAQGQ